MATSKPAGSPPAWILPVAAIVLTAAGLWWFSGGTGTTPDDKSVATAPASTPESAPPEPSGDAPPKHKLGMFSHGERVANDPSLRKREREDVDDGDDIPTAGKPGDRIKAKRHHSRRDDANGGKRTQDRHTLFASEDVAPYQAGQQTTLDAVKGLNGDAGTVSFWILPAWVGHAQDDAALVTFGNDVLRVFKNVSFLRYEVKDDNGGITGLGIPIGDWQPGQWHQVVATWDGRVLWFYVDGTLISTQAQPGPISLPDGTPVMIGSNFPANRPVASAVVADVRIRDRALNPTAVARRFASGPPVPPSN